MNSIQYSRISGNDRQTGAPLTGFFSTTVAENGIIVLFTNGIHAGGSPSGGGRRGVKSGGR